MEPRGIVAKEPPEKANEQVDKAGSANKIDQPGSAGPATQFPILWTLDESCALGFPIFCGDPPAQSFYKIV